MQATDFQAEKAALHFIEADTQRRAELVRIGYSIGHHCEIYSDMSELAAHPPRSGLIIIRDHSETGGIAAVLERLLSLGICLPVVAMDDQPTPSQIVQAIKDGALDFLVLPLEAERLTRTIARVMKEAHDVVVSRERIMLARDRLSSLSAREREVLEALTEGDSNKEIARTLSISPRTVEIHRANMMNKLGARHAVEAVRIKLDAGHESFMRIAEAA
ncbi:LuxR C-terminal-related transcriptional regulator [Erythrobacter sp.]|uniref:response regulator transcription factor n=1 Tax=Erythrobacter sp. TaxID=1042 RepID=UPI0025E598FD|nr:LuxR C-terminal-related transcriptional regulator [Erythrobacter sp.]